MSIPLQVFDGPEATVTPHFNPFLTQVFYSAHSFSGFYVTGKHLFTFFHDVKTFSEYYQITL